MMAPDDGSTDTEMLRVFWQMQWNRVARLEDQRLQFSNLVVAASVVAIGVAISTSDLSPWTAGFLALTIGATNGVAVFYGDQTEKWTKVHRERSDLLLQENWSYLYDLKSRIAQPTGPFGLALRFHQALHALLILAAVGVAIARFVG